MIFLTTRPVSRRVVATLALFTFFLTIPGAVLPRADGEIPEEEYAMRIQEVYVSRSEGNYDRALREIQEMIEYFAQSDAILRDLHNEMVKTIHQQRNAMQDSRTRAQLGKQREAQARETLRLYPGIKAGVGYATVDSLYNALRAEMFGELRIITSPDSCDVVIDGEFRGPSPFYAEYFPVGSHTVRVTKSQYEEKEITVGVEPAVAQTREISLKKIRGYKWWLSWVVVPVAAGVGLVLALTLGGDETPPADEPLPDPPAPPAN
jgi:hypothetical protein